MAPEDFGFSMFSTLTLKEEFISIVIGPAGVFPSVVTEDSVNLDTVFFTERQHTLIEQIYFGDRQFGVV